METNTNISQHTTPITMESTSSLFYRHIVDCPLSAFINVSTTGVLYHLIISGKPTDNELAEAWENLVSEYGAAIGDQEQQLSTNLYKQIVKLQVTIDQVELLVKALSKTYCGKFVTMLNELLNTSFVFDVKKPEEYDKNLQRCINRSKGFKITLDLKIAQFEAMQNKGGKGGPMTKEAFYGVLITLSDFAKYPVTDNVTVYEYCERIKRLNEYIAKMEKK